MPLPEVTLKLAFLVRNTPFLRHFFEIRRAHWGKRKFKEKNRLLK